MKNIEIAQTVVALGAQQGHWRVDSEESDPKSYYAKLTNGSGMPLTVSVNQHTPDKVTMRMGALIDGKYRVAPHEVKRYTETVPEASCSISRGAEAIMRDLARRVPGNHEAYSLLGKMQEHIATLKARRETLDRGIAFLMRMGYTPPPHYAEGIETYQVVMHRGKDASEALPREVKVTGYGDCTMEVSAKIDEIVPVLKGIQAAKT